MNMPKINLHISNCLAAIAISSCGLTGQKAAQSDTKSASIVQNQSQEGSSQVAQGSFALVQPDLNVQAALSQQNYDSFEIHLIPNRENAVKDYRKKVAYMPDQVIQIDEIIAGSYAIEVNVYAGSQVALKGKTNADVKPNESAKVDVQLTDASHKHDSSLVITVQGPNAEANIATPTTP